ncbi:MAG: hypothetical protein N2690_05450 [Rhodocyclaceae bacterium]|nr:hypothetical protein [Rhodocyclaceae bacterium]
MTTYCAWCATKDPTQPCQKCGHHRITDAAPSNEPCAYCGTRPTWPVVWKNGSNTQTVYLCAACDANEIRALEQDDGNIDEDRF